MTFDANLWQAVADSLQGKDGRDGVDGKDGTDGAPGVVGALNNMVPFSTLPGATDDDRLDKFIELYGTATRKPALVKDQLSDITLSRQHVLPKDGMKWIDPAGVGTQADSHNSNTGKVRLRNKTGNGVFRFQAGQNWNTQLIGLVFQGIDTPPNRLFEPTAACVPWKLLISDCAYSEGPGVLGSSMLVQPLDSFVCGGDYFDANVISDVVFNVGGSDNKIGPRQLLIDTQAGFLKGGAVVRLSSMSKTPFENYYLTARGANCGILVDGGGTGGLSIGNAGSTLEGHNKDDGNFGCLARLSTDTAWIGGNVNYGMINPAAAYGGATLNKGMIHAVKGNHTAIGLVSRYATPTAQTVPFWYQAAGTLNIMGIRTLAAGGVPFKPIVYVANAVQVVADGSVTVQRF